MKTRQPNLAPVGGRREEVGRMGEWYPPLINYLLGQRNKINNQEWRNRAPKRKPNLKLKGGSGALGLVPQL